MTHASTIEAIVMGGSAGAIEALNAVLPALPIDLPVPIAVVLHILPTKPSLLATVLDPLCALTVKEAEDKEPLLPSTVYVAPPNYHLLLERQRTIALSADAPLNFSRPSIDMLFESAADAFGPGVLGVLLSGANNDGARGLLAIAQMGGVTVVQSPESAAVNTMPTAALEMLRPTRVLPLNEIANFLVESTLNTPPRITPLGSIA